MRLFAVLPEVEQGPIIGVRYLHVNVGMTSSPQPNLEFDYSRRTTTESIVTAAIRPGLRGHVGDLPCRDTEGSCDHGVPHEDQTINYTMVHDADRHSDRVVRCATRQRSH